MSNLSFPIIELAYVHKIMYNDDSGCYHFDVSYLLDVNGTETVCTLQPTTRAQLLNLPMIDDATEISIMKQEGMITKCVGKIHVGSVI